VTNPKSEVASIAVTRRTLQVGINRLTHENGCAKDPDRRYGPAAVTRTSF
jgi:hypothetical protein